MATMLLQYISSGVVWVMLAGHTAVVVCVMLLRLM